MNGESDKMVPTKNTVDLARRLPNSQLVVYPDAGHGGVFQYHEDFVKRALELLDEQTLEAGSFGRVAGV
jgi:pimeloyl-ACP methyl ester carboxylesterase